MVEFLSDEWVAAFDDLLHATAPSDPRTPALRIVHTVTGLPGGRDVEYTIELSPEGNRVRPGRQPDPTITFRCDVATAVAINRGDEQTQAVFLDGRLRVGGDTAAMMEARAALSALGDVAEPLRRITTYPVPTTVESHA
jgi:hypothetical protein